jgi:intracellular multiplication protein IcmV
MFAWIGKGVKKSASTAGHWADLSLMVRFFHFIRGMFSGVFKRDQLVDETFAQAVTRLQLTPEDLSERKKIFKIQIALYGLGALAAGIYSIYLISHGYWMSVSVSVLIVIFLAINALKSHFWLFQIRQNKLGCTVHEWLNASIKESK